MAESQPSDQSGDETKREFEVGVQGVGGDYEHIVVEADSPEDAYDEAVKQADRKLRYDLEKPITAYQAYEVGEGVTHEP